jgi:predicted deacylase
MTHTPAQVAVESFRVQDLPAGAKWRGELVIDHLPDGQRLAFPAIVARGNRPGKTVLVTGAVHGDEYEGTIASQDVFDSLDPSAMRGTYFGIPVVNGPAFTAGRREGAWDHHNLARVFPGSASGSPTLRIAHAFQTHVLPQVDFLLDIHSGGNVYAIQPLAGYQLRGGAVGDAQRAAAIAFGFDLVWGTSGLPGRTLSAAGGLGVPAIYVEMPGEGRCRPRDRAAAARGIANVLAYCGVLDGPYPTARPRYFVEDPTEGSGHLQVDHPSPTSGIFVPYVDVWEWIEAGQPLGEVRHPDGTVLGVVPASRAGRVLFMRTLPRVFSGETVAYVLALPSKDT